MCIAYQQCATRTKNFPNAEENIQLRKKWPLLFTDILFNPTNTYRGYTNVTRNPVHLHLLFTSLYLEPPFTSIVVATNNISTRASSMTLPAKIGYFVRAKDISEHLFFYFKATVVTILITKLLLFKYITNVISRANFLYFDNWISK